MWLWLNAVHGPQYHGVDGAENVSDSWSQNYCSTTCRQDKGGASQRPPTSDSPLTKRQDQNRLLITPHSRPGGHVLHINAAHLRLSLQASKPPHPHFILPSPFHQPSKPRRLLARSTPLLANSRRSTAATTDVCRRGILPPLCSCQSGIANCATSWLARSVCGLPVASLFDRRGLGRAGLSLAHAAAALTGLRCRWGP